MLLRPPSSPRTDTHFPYPTLFRSVFVAGAFFAAALAGAGFAALPAGLATAFFFVTGAFFGAAFFGAALFGAAFFGAAFFTAALAGAAFFAATFLPAAGLALDLLAASSEEHTSELQSLMRSSYAVCCLKNKKTTTNVMSLS